MPWNFDSSKGAYAELHLVGAIFGLIITVMPWNFDSTQMGVRLATPSWSDSRIDYKTKTTRWTSWKHRRHVTLFLPSYTDSVVCGCRQETTYDRQDDRLARQRAPVDRQKKTTSDRTATVCDRLTHVFTPWDTHPHRGTPTYPHRGSPTYPHRGSRIHTVGHPPIHTEGYVSTPWDTHPHALSTDGHQSR